MTEPELPDPPPKPVIVLSHSYTTAEAASLCGVSEGCIRYAIHAGALVAPESGRGGVQVISGLELFKFFKYRRRRVLREYHTPEAPQ